MDLRVDCGRSRSNDRPAFSSYSFERSTRAAARRILGDTDVVDDLEDVPFTPDEIEHFAERKRMAEELDRAFENDIYDSSGN